MSDWLDNFGRNERRDFERWQRQVNQKLAPMIRDTSFTISIVPGKPDAKFAVELGFCIMLDKPIIAVVMPGAPVPAKLAKVCDCFVEWHAEQQEMSRRIQAAIEQLLPKDG